MEDAEDLSQEIFLEVIKSIDSFKGTSSFSTWIYRIIINRSTNILRKNNRSKIFSNIEHEIRQIRSDILDELSVEVPDTSYIKQKTSKLCDFQLQLQHVNIKQFLGLKKVYDPEQAQRLSALYRELCGCAGMGNKETE